MLYLHRGFFQCHGNLKSSNCLVDSRFVVKLSDFALKKLMEGSRMDSKTGFKYYESTWWSRVRGLPLIRDKRWICHSCDPHLHHSNCLLLQSKFWDNSASFDVLSSQHFRHGSRSLTGHTASFKCPGCERSTTIKIVSFLKHIFKHMFRSNTHVVAFSLVFQLNQLIIKFALMRCDCLAQIFATKRTMNWFERRDFW